MANPEVARAFVASGGAKLPPRKVVESAGDGRGKPLRSESPTQTRRNAFLSGIKAGRIELTLCQGHEVQCARCKRTFGTFTAAWRGLDLHHIEKRSHGQGYRGGLRFGVDDPRELELVCRACHNALESSPMWSGA